MRTIAIDESGYNGGHLLDSDQPIMALAAVVIDDSVAHELFVRNLPEVVSEIKHSKLYGSPRYDDGLVNLQKEAYSKRAATSYVVDKLSACCEAFVLDCVSDLMPKKDIGGSAYNNLVSHLINLAKTDKEFYNLLGIYERYSRGSSGEESSFFIAFSRQTDEIVKSIGEIVWKNPYIGGLIDRCGTTTGLVDGMLFELIRLYDSKLNEPFQILCDESRELSLFVKEFNKQLEKSQNVDFARNYKGCCFVNSQDHASVQLADILAGGAVRFAKRVRGLIHESKEKEYDKKIEEMFLEIKREDALIYKYNNHVDDNSQVSKIFEFWSD